MTLYKINSVRLSNLGALGDVIELSEEEYIATNYKSKLEKVERSPSKKKTKAEKAEPAAEEQEE